MKFKKAVPTALAKINQIIFPAFNRQSYTLKGLNRLP